MDYKAITKGGSPSGDSLLVGVVLWKISTLKKGCVLADAVDGDKGVWLFFC